MNRTHETNEQRMARWSQEDDRDATLGIVMLALLMLIIGFVCGLECATIRAGF